MRLQGTPLGREVLWYQPKPPTGARIRLQIWVSGQHFLKMSQVCFPSSVPVSQAVPPARKQLKNLMLSTVLKKVIFGLKIHFKIQSASFKMYECINSFPFPTKSTVVFFSYCYFPQPEQRQSNNFKSLQLFQYCRSIILKKNKNNYLNLHGIAYKETT